MSTLYLFRHAQAGPRQAYDTLSELGLNRRLRPTTLEFWLYPVLSVNGVSLIPNFRTSLLRMRKVLNAELKVTRRRRT